MLMHTNVLPFSVVVAEFNSVSVMFVALAQHSMSDIFTNSQSISTIQYTGLKSACNNNK